MLLSYNTYCLIKIKFFIYYPKAINKKHTGWNSSCRPYEEDSRAYLKTENVYFIFIIMLLKLFIPTM